MTWQDINLDKQYLTVRRSMRYNGARHKTEIGATKRKKVRTVDFCDTLAEEVTPFVYAHNVVCALEAENGEIYVGFCIESCSGVLNLCAERVAALNMYVNSGQSKIKRLITFRESAPNGGGSGMPCGACDNFAEVVFEKVQLDDFF